MYKKHITVLKAAEGGELKETEGQTPSTTNDNSTSFEKLRPLCCICNCWAFLRGKIERGKTESERLFLWWWLFWHHIKHFEVNQRFSEEGNRQYSVWQTGKKGQDIRKEEKKTYFIVGRSVSEPWRENWSWELSFSSLSVLQEVLHQVCSLCFLIACSHFICALLGIRSCKEDQGVCWNMLWNKIWK